MEEKFTGMDSREEGPEALATPRCKDTPVESKVPPACNAGRLPSAAQDMVLAPEEAEEADGQNERLYRIKREHDLAKAIKSDDAAVNVRVWDEAIFRDRPLSEQLEKAATWLRGKCLLKYCRGLVRDVGRFLERSYGGILGKNYETHKGPSNHTIQVEDLKGYKGWALLMPAWRARAKAGEVQPSRHRKAIQEIIWRATQNDWFEYPGGSWLHYFRFPSRYQSQA